MTTGPLEIVTTTEAIPLVTPTASIPIAQHVTNRLVESDPVHALEHLGLTKATKPRTDWHAVAAWITTVVCAVATGGVLTILIVNGGIS